jgi:CRP-like cAMP-binding protein
MAEPERLIANSDHSILKSITSDRETLTRHYTSAKAQRVAGVTATGFNGQFSNKVLTALPGEDFARLLPHLDVVFLSVGTDVHEFGEASEFVYFLETAVISHIHFLEDGSTTSSAIIGNEGLIGLSAILGHRPGYWARVTVAGTAVRVRAEIIREEFVAGRMMQKMILNYVSSRLAQLSLKAVCNGRHKLEERFCTWLLMVDERATENPLLLTHEEIAAHLGARRAGITSTCNSLREAGIIKYRRGLMIVADRERLRNVACECYQSLSTLPAGV